MQTLSHGVKKPETGDVGKPIFDALAANAQHQNDHTHDGLDTPKISSTSIVKTTQAILAANWASPVNGIYSQSVIITGGLPLDSTVIQFRNAATGELLHLSFDKVDGSTFKVYCNDSTLNVTAIYA